MTDYAAHSPQLGCKWNECHGNPDTVCPFGKDATNSINVEAECQHEWRQYWAVTGRHTSVPKGFYCIYNPEHRLELTKNLLYNISLSG